MTNLTRTPAPAAGSAQEIPEPLTTEQIAELGRENIRAGVAVAYQLGFIDGKLEALREGLATCGGAS